MLQKNVDIQGGVGIDWAQLLRFVEKGNRVTICDSGEPIAELSAPQKKMSQKKRKLGLLAGEITIPDDFDQTPESLLSYFK